MGEVEVIECDSIEAAELEYFRRRQEGCWQMVVPLKIVWSWVRLKHVARFSMKKVEKPYHIDDFIEKMHSNLLFACDVGIGLSKTMSAINKNKMAEKVNAMLKEQRK